MRVVLLGCLLALLGAPALAHLDNPNDPTVSHHPLWEVLKQTTIKQAPPDYLYRAQNPRTVLELADKPMSISGFIMPLEVSSRSTHFVLSRYSPDCPFCPQGLPNEVIEVLAGEEVYMQSTDLVTVSGRFTLQNNGERGLFFRIESATVR